MPSLQILNGSLKGRSFALTGKKFSLGRSPENDIQVEGVSVSRKHAQLSQKEGKFFIKDLKSKNGIFINGNKMDPDTACEIEPSQLVSLGRIAISIIEDIPEHMFSLHDTIGFTEEMREDELQLLDAMDIASLVNGEDEAEQPDRYMTAEKNVELIYKVSRILLQTMENDENINMILGRILNFILDLLKRIDRGAFILIDEETLEISKIIPITKKSSDDSPKMYSKTIVERVIAERKPVIMLDTLDEDEIDLSESMVSMRIRSVLCVPMLSNSRIRGVVYVDSLNKPYGFRSEDLFLLSALSIPAALAIEKAVL